MGVSPGIKRCVLAHLAGLLMMLTIVLILMSVSSTKAFASSIPKHKRLCTDAFALLDQDWDGHASMEEFNKAFASAAVDQEQLVADFTYLDQDNSGGIDYEEFASAACDGEYTIGDPGSQSQGEGRGIFTFLGFVGYCCVAGLCCTAAVIFGGLG